ncbi:MAG TPA: hypothetical protein VGG08_06875, partial [Solirubrobacteraceae bacterium]
LSAAVALAASLGPAAEGATAGSRHDPTAARPHTRELAGDLLGRIVLPHDARAGGSESDSSPRLTGPGARPAPPNLLDVHGFWRLHGDPAAAIRWIERHPPEGATRSHGGSGAVEGRTAVWYIGFSFRPRGAGLASEELIVAVTHASAGGTLLRADAQIVLSSHSS